MTKSPGGLTHRREQACINLVGYNSRVLDNIFVYDAGWGVLIQAGSGDTVFATAGNVIRGNTFTDTRATGGEPTIVLTDDYGLGCYDNRITANTIVNRGAGAPGSSCRAAATAPTTPPATLIDCGSSPPFAVVSGTHRAAAGTGSSAVDRLPRHR